MNFDEFLELVYLVLLYAGALMFVVFTVSFLVTGEL